MAEPRMNELARELLERSKARKVGWEETREANAYAVLFRDVALRISRRRVFVIEGLVFDAGQERGDRTDYELELTGERGRIIGSLAAEPGQPMHEVLEEIFELADQHIRDTGVNKALDYLKQV